VPERASFGERVIPFPAARVSDALLRHATTCVLGTWAPLGLRGCGVPASAVSGKLPSDAFVRLNLLKNLMASRELPLNCLVPIARCKISHTIDKSPFNQVCFGGTVIVDFGLHGNTQALASARA
jgi:hypothetical protein